MPVSYYLHTPLTEPNERRTIYRIVRLLQRQYAQSSTPVSLIINVDPEQTPSLKAYNLPQLDAILLNEKLVALLEFKNYHDPVIAETLRGNWYHLRQGKRHLIRGGRSKNPYYQVENARTRWYRYFKKQLAHLTNAGQPLSINLDHLHSFLLFHPTLHPKSRIARPDDQADYWLKIGSINSLNTLSFLMQTRGLQLTEFLQQRFVHEVLFANPWLGLQNLVNEVVGNLHVIEPENGRFVYPLHHFGDFTIGRSLTRDHNVDKRLTLISAVHAMVTVTHSDGQNVVKLYDLGSTNGTFVNGERVGSEGIVLKEGMVAYLGSQRPERSCQVSLARHEYGTHLPTQTAPNLTQ